MEKSRGLPGFVEDFLVVNAMDCSNSAKMRAADTLVSSRLAAALTELDNGSLAVLEEVSLRLGQDVLVDTLAPDSTLQALLDAGLCKTDHSEEVLRIFAAPWNSEARDALEQAISAVSMPPREWTQIASDLFSLERRVRRAVTLSLKDEHGDQWCSSGLGSAAESVLSLAVADG